MIINDICYNLYYTDTVRLVGWKDNSGGRIEIYHEGRWGTVCNSHWQSISSKVVCKGLGFVDGQKTGKFGPGKGRIWLDEVSCNETAHTRLQECGHSEWGVNKCDHSMDVGLICVSSTIHV